jgi:hypothetical protein
MSKCWPVHRTWTLQYSHRHSFINHCNKTYRSSWWFGYIFCSIKYIFKISLHLECYLLSPKRHIKKVNRLNRPKDISLSLRRVIRLSQWFITLCLWLYCIYVKKCKGKTFWIDVQMRKISGLQDPIMKMCTSVGYPGPLSFTPVMLLWT